MTTPVFTSERTDSLMDWFNLHSRAVVWGIIAVVVLAGGGWFYNRSRELKAQRAEKAYYAAQQSVAAGNLPLAQSDLKKMITRYDGTRSATLARIQLAEILYQQGKYQEGIEELKEAAGKVGSSEDFGSSVHLLLASGYSELGKHLEAAGEYAEAAKVARFDSDSQRYMSMAAMAYLNGGNKDKAKAIWTDLGEDSKGTMAGEARVRLGELEAQPVKGS